MSRRMITVDGCAACAHVVHAVNEIITIYPITPSTPIAEICDAWSSAGRKNIWGSVPRVSQMQSEGGVAGAVHGSLTAGALATTVSASQGLLLILPAMYKIAGELTPTVFHVTARSLACQGLSIFGDHSDVMATRATGFALLCSRSVQEAMDFALIAQAATLESRIPFLHFFDGFRTSHEIRKIEELTFDDMRAMIDDGLVIAHRTRGLSPDRPTIRGTAQNPDVYFQGRETVNPWYQAAPGIVARAMERFAGLTGRRYRLFDYAGDPEAQRVIVLMGSAAETAIATAEALNAQGARVGVLSVRLFRPFSVEAFATALPATVRAIAVLDRTKEPGAPGEPLYLDVRAAVGEAFEKGLTPFAALPRIVGGRYGLGSKDFTPAMAKAVFDTLAAAEPRRHFTVGITDDASGSSLAVEPGFVLEEPGAFRALFFGLGADGTVGANKSTIKIIGSHTANAAQGYFVYDSKKSGAMTVSHLRFGTEEIRHPYLVPQANFIACHNPSFVEKYDMLAGAAAGGVFLLTTAHGKDEIWETLPREVQERLIAKRMRFYIIDAIALAEELGLGARINIIMQTAFFLISGILPREEALAAIKEQIGATYGNKGQRIVEMNNAAAERSFERLVEVPLPATATSTRHLRPPVPGDAPEFVRTVTARMIAGEGDLLPVSAIPADGTWPTGTTQYEKRNIAVNVPVWEPEICIQCGQCSFVCPHATIRIKAYASELLAGAPPTFKTAAAIGKALTGLRFTVQVAPEDCTGCGQCVDICPAQGRDAGGAKDPAHKAIAMRPQEPLREAEAANLRFFLALPETDPARFDLFTIKGSQLVRPLFEYHGACAGCGETPYIRLLTQLFGDRLLIGNATGCSSIYGGNLPTTPYTKRADGRGPAWSNSLFEDNAEFALGMRQAVDRFRIQALEALDRFVAGAGSADLEELARAIRAADQASQAGIEAQRGKVAQLKKRLEGAGTPEARWLHSLADYLVAKSVWGVGGDGWAYDIGYGGLDQVLASGENINLLVLDTEVYSNTGGQMSKATPLAATAQFAAGGKRTPKKNLAYIMATYGTVYVAQVAFAANLQQTIRAFAEAEAYPGPSLVIGYAHCISHGFDLSRGLEEMKRAVACGHWPLFRYNPARESEGKSPLVIDSKPPTISFAEYAGRENRYRSLRAKDPALADDLMRRAEADVRRRWEYLQHLARWNPGATQ
ncbi:MAG: pyruvate:ferredoxin (flavodoxin) oxidoreductase [Candidatus Geothermincolia bacterium]